MAARAGAVASRRQFMIVRTLFLIRRLLLECALIDRMGVLILTAGTIAVRALNMFRKITTASKHLCSACERDPDVIKEAIVVNGRRRR